jgi:hypothetical protein
LMSELLRLVMSGFSIGQKESKSPDFVISTT